MAKKNKSKGGKLTTPAFATSLIQLKILAAKKDATYYRPTLRPHIKSYTHALSDVELYYNQIKTQVIKPEQKKISYFRKLWGWDWRKTLRFVLEVMGELENLDANLYFKKLKEIKEKQAENLKKWVYKGRGKEIPSSTPATELENADEEEIETLFLDAMTELCKQDEKKPYYRAKVKENLRNGDPKTVENFKAFKAKKEAEAQAVRELEFKTKVQKYINQINTSNANKITKVIANDQGEFMLEFQDGARQILSAQNMALLAA